MLNMLCLSSIMEQRSLDDSTSIYDMVYQIILSPLLRPIVQIKKIPFKISLLTDKGLGHPRALVETDNKMNVVLMPANTTPRSNFDFHVSLFKKYILQGYSCHRQ